MMRGHVALRGSVDRHGDGRFVVRLDGDADLAGAPVITDVATGLLGEPQLSDVEVDLRGVAILDSAGVRALLAARRMIVAKGAEFRVSRPQEPVAEVLRLLALDRLLGLRPSGQV